MYWAEALAAEGGAFAAEFGPLHAALEANEAAIIAELGAVQGAPADIGGYYNPDHKKATAIMRPSKTLNALIDGHLKK
jgi:isocitrate dehydrogenase